MFQPRPSFRERLGVVLRVRYLAGEGHQGADAVTLGLDVFIDRDLPPDGFQAASQHDHRLGPLPPSSGYAGDKLRDALKAHGSWTIEIIKRSDTAKGFVLLPRRWVVERTFAWLGRCRRLAKDWEKTIESSTAWAHIASIRMLTRRTARYCYA